MNGLFEIFFGLVFGGSGFAVFLVCFFKPEGTVVENAGIGMVAGAVFALIGIGIIVTGVRKMIKVIKAKKEGEHYSAKIVAHEPDYSIRVNGQPAISLVVRFKDSQKRLRQEVIKTGSTKWRQFQVGATVEIAEYDSELYVISKNAEMVTIPEQDEIMAPNAAVISLTGFTASAFPAANAGAIGMSPAAASAAAPGAAPMAPMGMAGAMSVACPGCGTVSMVMPGTTIVCKCGRQFRLTEDHMIV